MKYETINLHVPGQKTGPAVLTAYLLDALSIAPEKKRPLVLVAPGGGYRMCSDREKEPIAMQFLSMGCHVCTLDYSVAPSRFPAALQELALAVASIRKQAETWHVDREKILVCGFSAGGHLTGCLGAFWDRPFVREPLEQVFGAGVTGWSREETAYWLRPDGLVLCYPVITSGEYRHEGSFQMLLGDEPDQEWLERLSLENQITSSFPPVFLWHTVTDGTVPVENSLLLASALRRAGVEFEMHLYPHGAHGLALATEETAGTRENSLEPGCQSWISLVKSWIEHQYGYGS